VTFDEARNERGSRQIYPLSCRWPLHLVCRTHGLNPLPIDQDNPAPVRCVSDTVPHRIGHQQECLRSIGCGLLSTARRGECHYKEEKEEREYRPRRQHL
jgi:hypothetical protein